MTAGGGQAGLVRALSVWGLTAAIANATIGGGIFVLPAAMARAVGTAAPFYYLICAGAVGAVALCFAEAGSRISVSGGVSGYVEAALGRYAGFITAMMLWLASVLAAGAITAAIADAMARVLPVFGQPLWRAAFIGGMLATLAAVNVRGVRGGGRLVVVTILVKLLPLFALVIVGALHGSAARLMHGAEGKADVGRAMILGIFAFMGMETALGVSGEVKRPQRTVPLAILGSLMAITVLYIALQASAQSLLGDALKTSPTPLADAMGRVSPLLSGLLLVGAVVSMLGYMASNMLAAPRIAYAMAREGLLPRWLAAVDPRAHTPAAAILLHAALVAVLAVSGAFAELAILSTLLTLVAYIAGCIAAVILQRRGVATVGAPLNLPFTPAAAVVGVLAMAWIAAQGTWREAAAVLAAVGIASLVFLMSARRSPPS